MNTTATVTPTATVSASTASSAGKTRPRYLRQSLSAGLRLAAQWRLLLSWMLVTGLCTSLALMPLKGAIGEYLDRSLIADRLLQSLDPAIVAEALFNLPQRGYSPASAMPGLILFLLCLPWLSGMVQAAARVHVGTLKLGALWVGGWREYPQMARLWLWTLVPMGVCGAFVGISMKALRHQSEQWLLASDVELHGRAILLTGLALMLLAQATLDATRALLVMEPDRRSVVKAWWAAVRGCARQPSRLLLPLVPALLGVALALLLAWARTQVAPVSPLGLMGATVLTLALVAAIAWTRAARVMGLVQAARAGALR